MKSESNNWVWAAAHNTPAAERAEMLTRHIVDVATDHTNEQDHKETVEELLNDRTNTRSALAERLAWLSHYSDTVTEMVTDDFEALYRDAENMENDRNRHRGEYAELRDRHVAAFADLAAYRRVLTDLMEGDRP